MAMHLKNYRAIFCLFSYLFVSPITFGNPLENYISSAESTYRWNPIHSSNEAWGSINRYELISQNWRGHSWKHYLVMVRPKVIRNPDIAFLKIAGDGNGEKQIENLKFLAERGGAVAAVIMNVPNQPFYQGRREDALIAYTFNQYLKTHDETWPLLFPMVKSAIKAMDTIQKTSQLKHQQAISRFVLSGASKRGWTTWLTASVDKRIAAIAPIVIDTLNMKAQLQWSEQVYGKQSIKIKDYTELNLHRKMDNDDMQQLRSWVDPYTNIQNFTLPKLLLLGTNDLYWTIDSLRHYWNELPEPKLIYQTPNAGHHLNGGKQALQTLAAFFELIADKKPLPKLTWQFDKVNSIHSSANINIDQPSSVFNLWSAHSEDRDFRNNKWTKQTVKLSQNNRQATSVISIPNSGYQAYLLEAVLQTETGHPYKLSTMAKVTPDTKPCNCWIVKQAEAGALLAN